MSEVTKTIWQWIVDNLGWSIVILLIVLSGLFKVVKIEINPVGWLLGLLGKSLTKDVRSDVADLKKNTDRKFGEIKEDRKKSIDDLKNDYDSKISSLKTDLDTFVQQTSSNMLEMKKGTDKNCQLLKKRLDEVEKSNDIQTIRQIRAHVLDFANSCMNKRRHTKLEFENIISENEDYEKLVKKHKIKNAVYKEDFEFVMKIYHKCQEEGSFLKESDAEG